MRRSLARFSGPVSLIHAPSLADSITTTPEFRFSVHTGHDTLSASDVDEALSLLRSPQQIDALFTDIYLKKAVHGGYELAHQAINLRLNLRVLYTTGNTINDKMKTLFVDGAHFLQKPSTRFQLQNSVEVLLAP